MSGTLRLTSAEFKKIFKRPSVFIMAIILVVAVFVSLYTFDPNTRVDSTVDYNLTTSMEYSDKFNNGSTEGTKLHVDSIYSKTDEMINYYKLYNEKCSTLNSYYNDIFTSIEALDVASDALKEVKYKEVAKALADFKESLINFNNFVDTNGNKLSFIEVTTTTTTDASGDTVYTYLDSSLDKLNALIKHSKTLKYSDFLTTYNLEGNGYKTGLEKAYNSGINYIQTTFIGIQNTIYNKYVEYGKVANSKEFDKDNGKTTNLNRNNLESALKQYKTYLGLIMDNDYPLAVINKNTKAKIDELIDNAIDTITFKDTNTASEHKNAYDSLTSLNIINTLNNITSTEIEQINLGNKLVNDYVETQRKVSENKIALLDKINGLKNDEGIKNIQSAITEYYLLAESYNSYVYDSTILSITEEFSKAEYEDFYKYKLDEFNKYETNEKIALNKYYIANNTYENSYINNFTFNQKSDTKETNAYDFMFFAMELCTVVITVFAVMLVCSLITGETESGTIKLLLVRPYKRSKIVTAKLLATLFFVTVFMLFSSIISFVGGYFLFGLPTSNVLAVFNATTVFEISPLGLMLLNVLSLLLDVIFFVIIALMIAVLFKNYAGSISTMLVIVLLTYALNIIFGGTFWYSVLPGMNLHLFRYLGNTFISMGSGSILEALFVNTIESSMTFVFSILINISYMVIALAIAYSVFQKRDF